jgi:hypothetical protein
MAVDRIYPVRPRQDHGELGRWSVGLPHFLSAAA